MSLHKSRKKSQEIDHDSKNKINNILEETIKESIDKPQIESYYINNAEKIKLIEQDYFPFVAKRFHKSNPQEKEILIKLMTYFKGVEHIKLLQEFIRRESFLPRTGLFILELFNKSDAILEEGLARRLFELDNLTQRIKLAIVDGNLGDPLVNEFINRDDNEKEGIVYQLIEETGAKVSSFIIKIIEIDENEAGNVLRSVSLFPSVDSFMILEYIYKKTNRKDIAKITKKSVHLLKQKGVEVSFNLSKEKKESVLKKIHLPEPRAFISTIDPEGYRLIFMVKPITTYETKIFNIMINDMQGVHNIEVINSFRKESQLFIEKLLSEEKAEFLETQPDNAAFQVEEAIKISEEQGNVLSANILQWRNMFSDFIGVRTRPLIYECLNGNKIQTQSDLAGKVDELFEREDIIFWFIISEEAKKNWIKMTNILNSPLVLSDVQKEERIHGVIVDTVCQFFNEKRRKIFKRRLEELSYFLYAKVQEEKAMIALYAANSMVSLEMRPEDNRFCMSMVKKGYEFLESSSKEVDEKPRNLILDPKDFSLLNKVD